MGIKNKTALVTGGANGIGFVYVKELLKNGAKGVAILDLVNSNGKDAVSKLEAEFGKGSAIFIPCDVTKPQELEAAFQETIAKFQGLDIVINNAGIMDDARWELEINLNLNAVVKGTMLGLDYMGKHKGGKGGIIVNASSVIGLCPFKAFPVYTGTKFAVVGLSRAFSEHYDVTGVKVMVICPGRTDTELISGAPEKSIDLLKKEDTKEHVYKYPGQTVDDMAPVIVKMLETGENGSVWVAEGGEPAYTVNFPFYQDLKVVT